MIMILLLFIVSSCLAHNWMNSPSRSRLSSQVNPCISSNNGGRPHVRAQPGQKFQIEWSTGHYNPGSFHYFIFVKASDAGQLKRHANEDLLKDYFNNAPKDQNVRLPPIYTKYHRKLRDNEFSLPGELFKGKRNRGLVNYLKRQMKRGEDPYYAVRPPQFKGEFLKETGDNTFRNCYTRPHQVNPDNVFQYEHHDRNGCLENDRRVFYRNSKYPWIIGAQRYFNCQHDAFHGDFSYASFPANTPPGRYIIHYSWRGFFDCIDVELTRDFQEHPYGTDFGPFPPSKSKFKDVVLPPIPGEKTAPPTPRPTTVPPTPAPVIPSVAGKLALWHRCAGGGGGAAVPAPPQPAGTQTGLVRVQRGVKMLYEQTVCHDWTAKGGVTTRPGSDTPVEHGIRIEGTAAVGHAQSPTGVPVSRGVDYTMEFWYYSTMSDRVQAGAEVDVGGQKKRMFASGARTGANSAFQIDDAAGFGLRVVATAKFPGSRWMIRLRFKPTADANIYFGIGPGETATVMYQVAVGLARDAGNAGALMHSRFNPTNGDIRIRQASEPKSVTPFTRADANGAGRFALQADASILFEDSPAVRSPRTYIAVSNDAYVTVEFTEAYKPSAPPSSSKQMTDASGYARHGMLLGAVGAANGVGSACRSVSGSPIADLGKFDLYGSEFSLALWFSASADGGAGTLLHKAGNVWSIDARAGNKIAATVDLSGGRVSVEGTVTAWKRDEYNHVGVTYDGTNVKLYYNGREVASKAGSGTVKSAPSARVLLGAAGSVGSPTTPLSGGVADIRVYQSVVKVDDVFKQRGTMPGGARFRDQFARVDHCSYHSSAYTLQGECKRMDGSNPEQCFAECAAMPADECDGVSVQPLVHPSTVYKSFRDTLLLPKHATCERAALTAGKPAAERSYACFAVKLGRSERFFQVEDIEDPAFYGTCYVRVPVKDEPVAPEPLANLTPATQFLNGCISCADAKAAADNDMLPMWRPTSVCVESCEA